MKKHAPDGACFLLGFSRRSGVPFHIYKIPFDCSVVVGAAVISLIADGTLLGVREGTVIAAVFVGVIIKPISRGMLGRLKAFLEK